MRAFELTKTTVTYQGSDFPALNDVSIGADEGEIVLLLGSNNAGKSTFCRLLNGLVPKSTPAQIDGKVEVLGRDANRTSVARLATMVGMVFQEPENQLFCMSVEEEVAFGPENVAIPRAEIIARVEWALEAVGLTGYNARSPSNLSGGEKQRLAIAAALSMRPRLLVLDEPAYALDPTGRVDLYALLRDLRERYGMTILIAERDAEEMAELCDRMILLRNGRVVADGAPNAVLSGIDEVVAAGVSPPQIAHLSSLLADRFPGKTRPFFTTDDAEKEIADLVRATGSDAP
ncbi:MAG: ATP-binding cassette domain-containing protein [Candidatus Thermoplasmatota archaeon]|nr:ATP-binding cassette domain-containing protein [Candidatus Thermoplasmatota archaeon]